MAGGRRRHVGEHDVDRPAERRLQAVRNVLGHEVGLDQRGSGDRLDRQDVEADHRAGGGGADPGTRELSPAAGGGQSEERREGKEWDSSCGDRWWASKKKK